MLLDLLSIPIVPFGHIRGNIRRWRTPTRRLSFEDERGLAEPVVAAAALNIVSAVAVDLHAGRRAGTGSQGRVSAEHGNTRSVLGASERDHVLADVGCNELAVVAAAVGEDVLDEVVSELISSDVDQGHARALRAAFADTLKVTVEELVAADFKALLDDLGSILVHAVLGRETEDVVDRAVAISRSPMLADVLNAPVAELAVRDDIDASKHFIDARTLRAVSA
jgi:hypothetical protein